MMKRLACAFAVVSLALTGCGGSICEDFKDVGEELEEKAKPCSDGSPDETEEFNVQQCESDLEKCTDEDKETLETYISCLSDVDTCEKGKEDAFGGAVLACAFAAAGKLSDACTSAVAQDVRHTVASHSSSR